MASEHLKALELAKDGKWDEAHALVQRHSDRTASLIHAYLHRVEGDVGNARYWYRRAGEEMPDNTLEQEFSRLYEIAASA